MLSAAYQAQNTQIELCIRLSDWLYILLLARGDKLARTASQSVADHDALMALRSALSDLA